ncbi:hypothetical protein [Streptomyces erythrochromogenes]|uniref:hypothetical protein n=1 Tax=Streptomyces erythrochromogenes TaxID=285574 RepID=UPI0036F776A0
MPHRPQADPVGLDEDSHWDLLHQCPTDTRLDLDVRAAGAILLLFGQHLPRIAALPATALTTHDGSAFLTRGRTPIPLPTTLADIPNRPARTTALVARACDLPPAVLGPMLDLHPITAVQWRRRAATDWTAYLEARTAAGDQGRNEHADSTRR